MAFRWAFSVGIAVLTLLLVAVGCSDGAALLEEPLVAANIDKIQVVLAMGNPEYGADSKIIEDSGEIEGFVRAFNGASVGERVRDRDLAVSDVSRYLFVSGNEVVREIIFNGNDTERVWYRSNWHYISYPDQTPLQLYRASDAEVIVVDENLEEMQRPE